MNLKQIVLIFCLIAVSFSAFSQEDLKIETIDGKKYYLHKVEPGHTLYAISKKYLVEISDILSENPEVAEGLKIGQELKIAVVRENRKLHKTNNPELEGNFILHTVDKGETLYSLSKKYNVEIADIVAENPGIQNSMQPQMVIKIRVSKVQNVKKESISPASTNNWKKHIVLKGETAYSLAKKYNVSIDSLGLVNNHFQNGLRENDTINIPVKSPEVYKYIKEKLSPDTLPVLTSPYREFQVGLLLPFSLEENGTLENNPLLPQSLIALQFYEGILMALDSLKQLGFRAKIHVFDTGKDSLQIVALFKKPEMAKMDIFIGPLYLAGFNVASKFAKNNGIPIVSPFVQQSSIITDNGYVLKSLPSPATLFEQLAVHIGSNYSGQNVIMVHKAASADKPMATAFSGKMAANGNTLKEVIYSTSGFNGVNAALSTTKNNIIVVPSNDQVFITDLITKLNFSASDNSIILFGTDNWLNFENLDLSYLHKLNTHLPLINFIDYSNESVKAFVNKYRDKYATDPSSFVFQGYDVAMFYLSSVDMHGKEFIQKGNLKKKGLQLNFNHSRISESSGFENKSIIIVKYEDYKLKKVN